MTVVDNVSPTDSLLNEEIFGPCLPIITIHSVDEAIRLTNEMGTPLAMYVFSDDKKIRKKSRPFLFHTDLG